MKAILANIIVFQIGWLCCVLAGANHIPWIGTTLALLIVARHLGCVRNARTELLLIASAGIIGLVWDSLLVYAGLLQYPSGTLVDAAAPHWIIAMWLLFATTLNVSLRWLKHRLLMAAIVGAMSGPTAWYTGYKLGGVQIPDIPFAMAVLALGWALLLPLLMSLSNRFDGMKPGTLFTTASGWQARV